MRSIFEPKDLVRTLIITMSLAQGALALDEIPQYQIVDIGGAGQTTQLSNSDPGHSVMWRYDTAQGLAGFSDYSNIASATAPPTPANTEPPSVAITEPVNGAQVSGRVSIRAVASDNVAVTDMSITYSGLSGYAGICSGANVAVLNCTWNTKRIRAGTYTLTASASDALGNGSNASISVELVDSGGGGGGRCHPKKGC